MVINIQFSNVDSTDALKNYAYDKVDGLQKYFDNIQQADVNIGRTTNHHKKGDVYYAEVNLHVPGDMIRVRKETTDLYKAIDKVRDHMTVELKEFKDQLQGVDREEIRETKSYQGDEEFEAKGQEEYEADEYREDEFEETETSKSEQDQDEQ
ncbi:MAG: ribosome hibernation-promoting factor, HPF/YfiA family [Candidatus Magasanikbacteria bacterium]